MYSCMIWFICYNKLLFSYAHIVFNTRNVRIPFISIEEIEMNDHKLLYIFTLNKALYARIVPHYHQHNLDHWYYLTMWFFFARMLFQSHLYKSRWAVKSASRDKTQTGCSKPYNFIRIGCLLSTLFYLLIYTLALEKK